MAKPTIDEVCPVITSMLDERQFVPTKGNPVAVHSNIPRRYAEALFDLVVARKPELIIEIGLAFGLSALTMLAGQEAAGIKGKVISIDPGQTDHFKNNGVAAIKQAGFAKRHELIEGFDYTALPDLLKQGTKAQMGYIDGWHTFDYTLVDWWYLDKMVEVGGVIGFNDCGYPAVDRVISFVQTHRSYKELDVGLATKRGVKETLTRKPKPWDRYFEKLSADEPAWDFYADF